ncbi:polymorphic toxin type 30 domain-containing protein [Cytobacillus depressus]
MILRICTLFSWLSLIALVLSFIFVEESRKMYVQFLWSFYVIIQFWFLCRSKTLSWKKYTLFFLVGAWLIAPLTSMVVRFITFLFGGMESDIWSMSVLTPIAEEVIKLIPLGVYLFVSRRASSLSLTDFALIGAASGAGFQFFEETTRRIASGNHYGVTLFGGKVLNWDLFTLFPGYFEESFLPDKMTAGHSLLTAMIALGIGLALRYSHRFKRYTYLFPLFLLFWSIFDHAIWNASYNAPKWLEGFHDLLGSGYASKPVFLLMLCAALFIDYWELNRLRGKIPLLDGERTIHPFSELWNLIISACKDRQVFAYLLLFYRERRELAFTQLHGKKDAKELLPKLQASIQNYYAALTVISIIFLTVFLLVDWVNTYNGSEGCIACLFDMLQNWWDRLSGWEKGLIILGAFALSFPLLGFWSSVGMVSSGIGIAAGGHQTADVVRHPKKLLTPETAIAIGIDALMTRIPFGRALEKIGKRVSSKLKPFIKKILPDKKSNPGKHGSNPKSKSSHSKVTKGDFSGVKDINDFRSRIPGNATQLPWKKVPGGAAEGEKYRWTDSDGNVWNVRAHGIDPSAPAGSNASKGWIYRVEVKTPSGKWTMDSQGNFYKKNVFNPNSPHYDEAIANDSHIPFTG